MTDYIVSVDLGQAQDFSAVAVLRRQWWRAGESPNSDPPRMWHEVQTLHQWPLGTLYPEIADDIATQFRRIENSHSRLGAKLVVDQGGPGRPVIDMLKQQHGLRPVGVTITGGDVVHERTDGSLTVPKRDITSALIVAAQAGDLKVDETSEFYPTYEEELATFGYKINQTTGHTSYESLEDRVHDDLVVAVALGLWYSTTQISKAPPGSGGYEADLAEPYNPFGRYVG